MPKFVIHQHKAKNLHWDFRIQLDGVLKSWALPRGIPQDSRTKRLAVQTVDHPLAFADFEGNIKEGPGKGNVKIWDTGEFDLIKRDRSVVKFEAFGNKMKGEFALVNAKMGGKKENWLFTKL